MNTAATSCTVSAPWLREALEQLQPFVSRDQCHPALAAVGLCASSQQPALCATDGSRLAIVGPLSSVDDFPFRIPAEQFSAVLSGRESTVTFSHDHALSFPSIRVLLRDFIRRETPFVHITRQRVPAFVTLLSAFPHARYPNSPHAIRITHDRSALRVGYRLSQPETASLEAVFDLHQSPYPFKSFGINPNFLLDALKLASGFCPSTFSAASGVYLHNSDPLSPIYVTPDSCDRQIFTLTMPFHLP